MPLVGFGQVAVLELVLCAVVTLAHLSWHLWLKIRQKHEVSAAVWLASATIGCSALSALVVSVGLLSSAADASLSVWVGFAIIVCFLMQCFGLFLLSRGLFVLAPSLSDAAKVHATQLLALSGVLALAALLFCLPLPDRVVFSIQLAAGSLMLLYVGFLIIRLFQAIKATRAAVEMQNLIPQPRRVAFDKRFKQFLILEIAGIGSLLVLNVLFALFVFWLDFSAPLPALALTVQIMHLFSAVLLNLGVGWLFLATSAENLMLWSSSNTDGFDALQEQDSDLFA